MPRYQNSRILTNASNYYKFLRKKRGNLRAIQQFATPIIRHPTVSMRASTSTNTHLWRYGDRFYKLAHVYYGDSRFWWIIAWWNGTPTEADINFGDVIEIPTNIEEALRILGY